MRIIGLVSTGVLALLLGVPSAVSAQDRNEEVKPQQEEPRPEPKKDEAKPRKEDVKPPKQDEAKPPKDEKAPKHEEANAPHDQEGHGRPAGKSAHIPDDKFRAQFGRSHTVVINRPVVIEGQPGFVYGGYSFVIVDAWPVGWAYTDDCYIDYADGDYFLFDVLHPGVRVALFVVM